MRATRSLRPAGVPRRVDRSQGFTLLELIVALALLAVTIMGALGLRPGSAMRAAESVRAFLLWGRLEAMWSGHAVALVPSGLPGLSALGTAGNSGIDACSSTPMKTLRLREYGKVRVLQELRSGVVWLPSGGARSCEGGGVISGRMVLSDGSTTVDVIVSSLGRVRVEVER